MDFIDIYLALIYVVVSVVWGLWKSLHNPTQRKHSVSVFWLSQKNFSALPVALTLMATFISSNTLVSHPGVASQKGLVLLPGFLLLPFIIFFAAKKLVPFYRQHVRLSAYEYLGLRFGHVSKSYASAGFIVDRVFDMGVTLVTCGIFIQILIGLSLGFAMVAVLSLTLLYVLIGGIAAVVWNDALQGVLLLLGAITAIAIISFAPFNAWLIAWEGGLFSLGDWSFNQAAFGQSTESSPYMVMAAMGIIWARKFCCDQTMVQRYLIAHSNSEATKGLLIAALFIVLMLLIFNAVGAGLWGFYQGESMRNLHELQTTPPTIMPSIRDQILPHFVLHYFPIGAKGIMLAAVVAAAMSSLSSDVNSVASVLFESWLGKNSLAKQTHQTTIAARNIIDGQLAGRLMVLLAGISVLIMAFSLVPSSASAPLAIRVLSIASALSGAVLGLFCLAYFTVRTTSHGALMGLLMGSLVSTWAVFTSGDSALWFNEHWRFPLNPLLSGVFAQWVVIVVGYLVSICCSWAKPTPTELNSIRFYTIWAKNN